MSKAHVEISAHIPATPEQVYAILKDYITHHPRILPGEYFYDFKLEEGGLGAGTVFRVKVRAMGREIPFHMRVSEPEPGRRLVETELDTGMATSFILTPESSGESRLTIASEWQPAEGLSGLLERLGNPILMRKIYKEELQNIANYAHKLI